MNVAMFRDRSVGWEITKVFPPHPYIRTEGLHFTSHLNVATPAGIFQVVDTSDAIEQLHKELTDAINIR